MLGDLHVVVCASACEIRARPGFRHRPSYAVLQGMTRASSSIRFDPRLREQIVILARAEHRTFSGQVQALVERALRQREQAFEAELVETFDARVVDDGR